MSENKKGGLSPYLTPLGAWALAFGCAVGWGSFVMPGTTFLPIAGPLGTVLGIGIGALIMLLIGANYHFLMNEYPDAGGTYTYSKVNFGSDHGFLNAWFLILTYVAIIWANATALPLIARNLLGGMFQVGFDYEIAGFHVYMGEVLLAIASLVIAAVICLRARAAGTVQTVMAVALIVGVTACFIAVMGHTGGEGVYPALSVRQKARGRRVHHHRARALGLRGLRVHFPFGGRVPLSAQARLPRHGCRRGGRGRGLRHAGAHGCRRTAGGRGELG